MKVLIKGALGFIGLNLISELKTIPETRIVLQDLSSVEVTNPNIQFISEVSELTEPVDALVMLAGISGKMSTQEIIEKNVSLLDQTVSDVSKISSNFKIVFPSTQLVYEGRENGSETDDSLDPLNGYARSKLECEKLLQNLSRENGQISYTIMRITNPFGPHVPRPQNYNYANQMLYNLYKGEKIELFNKGETLKNYIPIRNLSTIMSEAVESDVFKNQIINVGSSSQVKMKDFFESARRIFENGEVILSETNYEETVESINTEKLYSLLEDKKLQTNEEGIIEFKNFFDRNSNPDFLSFF